MAMDTPERSKNSHTAAYVSKFEESPIFNFLNSLSPIKPVKSIHINQMINPLTFASLPSVFASPHVGSHWQSRFLQRRQISDSSNTEFPSDDGSTLLKNEMIENTSKKLDKQGEHRDSGLFVDEVDGEPSYGVSNIGAEFANSFDYNCGSPSCDIKVEQMEECSSSTLFPFVQKPSQRGLFDNEANFEGITQTNQNKEAISCGWENLTFDDSDLLKFESHNYKLSHNKPTDPGVIFREGSEAEYMATQPEEGIEVSGITVPHDTFNSSRDDSDEKKDAQHISCSYHETRRRCLVFGMSESQMNHLQGNAGSAGSDCSMLQQSAGDTFLSGQHLVPTEMGNESSGCILHNMDLHIYALAAAHKDEASDSRRLLIGSCSPVNFNPPIADQELQTNTSAIASLKREIDTLENVVLSVEDGDQVSGYKSFEEINLCSPKSKRCRLKRAGEGVACKRCNCKKSKCLKLYCECFAAGIYCMEPCACIDCFNKPAHIDTVLATRKQIETRNPLAFAPKVIKASDSQQESWEDLSKTPASARHKRGCNCKKSGCLKKYCECYQGGVGCSINCRCERCQNTFGRKDGPCSTSMEADSEEDETNLIEKRMLDRSLQKTDLERSLDYISPATPLQAVRQSVQHPYSSNKKSATSSFPHNCSSSSFYASQILRRPNFFQIPSCLDKRLQMVKDDDIPEFLQVGSSPIACIKSVSPNRKRVLSPHNAGLSSPGFHSSRKLILQSIPSFPCLTSNR